MQTTTTEIKPNDLKDRNQAAEILHVTPGTLANWASTGKRKLPSYKIGKRVFYREADLLKWIELQAVNPIN